MSQTHATCTFTRAVLCFRLSMRCDEQRVVTGESGAEKPLDQLSFFV